MSMASFDVGMNTALKADVAAKLGVSVDRVLLNAASGSVVVSVAVKGYEDHASASGAASVVAARSKDLVNVSLFGRFTVSAIAVVDEGHA